MTYQCPKCQKTVYTRRRKTCEFCGANLPEKMVLSKEEIEKIDKMESELHKKHRERMKDLDKKTPGDSYDIGGGIGFDL